jgi:hypothetical protein
MNQSDLQQLLSGSQSTIDPTEAINKALAPMMPMLSVLFVIGTVLSVILVIYFIVNLVQKQHTHRAILRIDKNLQRLVDAQLPTEKPADNTPVDSVQS